MDVSDFYDIAVDALEALDNSVPKESSGKIRHLQAAIDLRVFIRAADRERAENNTRSNYRAHLKEGEIA